MKNKFFINDPEQDETYYYPTKEKMLFDLREIIESFADHGEWIADPRQITAGEITIEIVEKIVAKRSDQMIIDNYDDEGRYWKPGVDEFIDYEIKEVED